MKNPTSAAGPELLVDLKVELAAGGRRCHGGVAVITPSSTHLELRCTTCNTRVGRLTPTTSAWLAAVVGRFGEPDKPITIRKKEKPPTET
jgi:hypothetical protein